MRSKAAKTVLWVIVGCIAVMLAVLLVQVIIAACGGTGEQDGSILGSAWNVTTSIFWVFVVALVFVWLLTEPSFKKKEEEPEIDLSYRTQYVKKSAHAQVKKPAVVGGAPAPAEDEKKKIAEPAEEAKPVEEGNPAEEEAQVEEESPVEDEAQVEEESPVEEESCADEADEEPEDDDDEENDEDEVDDDAEEDDDSDDDTPDIGVPLTMAAAALATTGPETVLYRYRRSFASRMIQASDHTKEYYDTVKNKLLSYKNVKARSSWSFESFNRGRVKLAKLNVRGKTLVMYIAIDPASLADTKYHVRDMSEKAKYAAVPTMIRVKSPRGAKYACELIERLMEDKEIPVNPNYREIKSDLAYRSNEDLIEEGLIKVVYNKNMDPNGEYIAEQADISGIFNK